MARGAAGPLVSPEVVVVAALPLRKTGTDANVQVRGVSPPRAGGARQRARSSKGASSPPASSRWSSGRNATGRVRGLDLGAPVKLGGATWTVVGVFDAGGSAFDSEIWCDANLAELDLPAAARASTSR